MDVLPTSVLSVQFSTMSCRVGTQLISDFNDNPSRVSALSWPDTIDINMIPSVFLGVDDVIVAFGNEAKTQWLDQHEGRYFENVIKSVYSLERFNEKSEIHDCRGFHYNAKKILIKLIGYIREFAMSKIKSRDGVLLLEDEEIKWVFALTSVRADQSVRFFKDAWYQAYPSEDIVTTLTYADAALTYHAYLRLDGFNINELPNGSRIMLIGFEDELDSFNVYEKRGSMDFKQVTHYLSGGSTRNLLKQLFDEFFIEVFGSWVWQVCKQVDEDIELELERTIKLFVEYSDDLKRKVTLRITPALPEVCLEHTNMTVERTIELSAYSSQMVLRAGDKIRIDPEIFTALLQKALVTTIRNMKYLLDQNDKYVEMVILSGNMDSCKMLRKEIETQFPHIKVCSSKSTGVEVLSGAAMYGHKPIVVSTIFSGAQVLIPRRVTNLQHFLSKDKE